jgi:hypothetical protein
VRLWKNISQPRQVPSLAGQQIRYSEAGDQPV